MERGQYPALGAVYSRPTFGLRKGYTDELMKVALAGDAFEAHREPWSAIIKEVNRILPFRNDLAHEPIRARRPTWLVSFGNLSPEESAKLRAAAEAEGKPYGVRSHEIYTAPKKLLKGAPEKTIEESALRTHLEETKALRLAIDSFGHEIEKTLQKQAAGHSALRS